MKIYHNPRCRKSRETLQLLKDAGKEPEIIEYLKTPPSTAQLKEIIDLLQVSPEQIIRKGEKLYKDKFKNKKIDDQEWLKILNENPVLIERPIVISNNKAVIGRPPENVKVLI
ncbi:MAG: arsenate reductase (glutaredoxin) [Cyclobacteriaceae bacterium]